MHVGEYLLVCVCVFGSKSKPHSPQQVQACAVQAPVPQVWLLSHNILSFFLFNRTKKQNLNA